MKFEFFKLEGAGNDFVLIDLIASDEFAAFDWTEFSKRVCSRKLSVGADGLLLLSNDDTADFNMRIFNADGSEAEMCGNGARCAAKYYFLKTAASDTKFNTMAGLMKASLGEEGNVLLSLTDPSAVELDILLDLDNKQLSVSFINTGVPHAVVEVERLEEVDIDKLGRLIRYNEKFAPAGTNVNFVKATSSSAISVRTYERGVEAETLACGTGVTASAIVESLKNRVEPPIEVFTKGGEILKVHFTKTGSADLISPVNDVKLEGNANLVYSGSIDIEEIADGR